MKLCSAGHRGGPRSPKRNFGLGRVLEQRGDLAAALAEYGAALEQNPQLAQAQSGRGPGLLQ